MEMKDAGGRSVHVLVVEDEALVRMSTVVSLQDLGCGTLEAASGDEALGILEQHPEIQVLFTDIQMPGGLDGIGLARVVMHRWPHIEIVICSARVTPPPVSFPDGARFIAKPYYDNDLRAIAKA